MCYLYRLNFYPYSVNAFSPHKTGNIRMSCKRSYASENNTFFNIFTGVTPRWKPSRISTGVFRITIFSGRTVDQHNNVKHLLGPAAFFSPYSSSFLFFFIIRPFHRALVYISIAIKYYTGARSCSPGVGHSKSSDEIVYRAPNARRGLPSRRSYCLVVVVVGGGARICVHVTLGTCAGRNVWENVFIWIF